MANNMPFSVTEIGELLDAVTSKLPKLINGLLSSVYSQEAGKNIGAAVGSLYKELIDSGLPQEAALQMAKDYMISLKNISASINKNEAS